MRALAIKPGRGEGLRLLERPKPQPGSGEVLVQVLEVGLDGTDKALRTGRTTERRLAGRISSSATKALAV